MSFLKRIVLTTIPLETYASSGNAPKLPVCQTSFRKVARTLFASAALLCGLGTTVSAQEVDASESPTLPSVEIKTHPSWMMFDYQMLSVAGLPDLDLLGYHIMTPVNDWLSLGLGIYAPVAMGEYGGFMAFGGLAHAQVPISDKMFLTGGLSFGGGGGGRSTAQSVVLSGTGGYVKGYAGIGYDFGRVSAGVNISHFKFINSAIDSTQANVFAQIPIGHQVGPFGRYGENFSLRGQDAFKFRAPSILSVGLDNFNQINPTGSFKGTLRTVDVQYTHFMNDRAYWFFAPGVGYQGLATYNQVLAGLGMRYSVSPRINLYGQLGLGSGGYAPALIDTGTGLLVYPKASAEFKLSDRIGIALTSGYMMAPDGTSRNMTYGLALNTHFGSAQPDGQTPTEGRYQGYRFSAVNETKLSSAYAGVDRGQLNLLAGQIDFIAGDYLYVPLRGAISYEAYKTFPGYGEVTAGIGLNSKYSADKPFQVFGSLQGGVNVEGLIVRGVLGVNYGLSEDLALRAAASQTFGQDGYRSSNIELGVTYRFSRFTF